MTDNDDILKRLESAGAVLRNGHFVYQSGKHGSVYIDKDMIYLDSELTSDLCCDMAEPFLEAGIDAIVAPEKGGIILSQWISFHTSLQVNRKVPGFYAEKNGKGGFTLTRGRAASFLPNKRVLIAEDVLNSGGSVLNVVRAVRDLGSIVVGVVAIANRGGVTAADVGNPEIFHTLLDIALEAQEENECSLCANRVPISIEVGKGKQFLDSRPHTWEH